MPTAPLLVLCLPRSYSSVVCAMLGQHPELFGFPELNLFCHDTVGQLLIEDAAQKEASGICHAVIAGTLRSLEQLGTDELGTLDPLAWLRERADWPLHRVLDVLLARVAPRRGVDKSPRTALCSECLGRARRQYPNARFLHLTRHPVTQIASLTRFMGASGRPGSAAPGPAFAAHLRIAIPSEWQLDSWLADRVRQLAALLDYV